MKLILEVFGKTKDEETGEIVETIIHSEIVESKEEALARKQELLKTHEDFKDATFYLHYCRHDEHTPCTREKI